MLLIISYPENGYASISTISSNFTKNIGDELTNEEKKALYYYLPLDGMNEKGLTVSINILDFGRMKQNTILPDITTTVAIRYLLDKTDSVDKAYEVLKSFDMQFIIDLLVHFAITDASGKSIVVEYINNEINYVDSPVSENFYLVPG